MTQSQAQLDSIQRSYDGREPPEFWAINDDEFLSDEQLHDDAAEELMATPGALTEALDQSTPHDSVAHQYWVPLDVEAVAARLRADEITPDDLDAPTLLTLIVSGPLDVRLICANAISDALRDTKYMREAIKDRANELIDEREKQLEKDRP